MIRAKVGLTNSCRHPGIRIRIDEAAQGGHPFSKRILLNGHPHKNPHKMRPIRRAFALLTRVSPLNLQRKWNWRLPPEQKAPGSSPAGRTNSLSTKSLGEGVRRFFRVPRFTESTAQTRHTKVDLSPSGA